MVQPRSGGAATKSRERKTEETEITEHTDQNASRVRLFRYFRLFRFSPSSHQNFLLKKQEVATLFHEGREGSVATSFFFFVLFVFSW
jgi:hypothetical protein